MTVYNIGLNTGNTGSITAYALQKATPTAVQGGVSVYIGAMSALAIGRLALFVTLPGGLSGTGTVTNAKLYIRNADAMSAGVPFELRSFATAPVAGQATWNSRLTGTAWAVAGALTGADVNATPIATGTASTTDSAFFVQGAGLDTWVQGCIDGSIAVKSLILSAVNDTTSFPAATQNRVRCDGGADGQRPYLTFDFTPTALPNATISDPVVSRISGTATFTVTLSSTYASDASVNFATADGTATAGVRYTTTTATVTIPAGQTTGTVTVPILP